MTLPHYRCPVCDRPDLRKVLSRKQYQLFQCRHCRIIFIPEQYYRDYNLRSQYTNDATSSSKYYSKTEEVDSCHFSFIFNQVEKFVSPGRLLDVGCSVGHALTVARSRGWEIMGIEPNPVSADIAREKGFAVYNDFFDDCSQIFLPASFDAILLGDVLEHVANPVAMLKQAYNLISPKGVVVIITINMENFLCRRYQIKPQEHLVYFTPQSLGYCLEKAGFEVKFCAPYARERNLTQVADNSSTSLGRFEKILTNTFNICPPLNFIARKILKMIGKDELLAIGLKV